MKDKTAIPLAEHDFCMLADIVDWLVPIVWKKRAEGERRVVFSGSLIASAQAAAREGGGLTPLPCYLGDADPELVRATELLEPLTLELWLLTHPDLRHTARVKTLLSFLYGEFSKQRALFEGKRPQTRKQPPLRIPG